MSKFETERLVMDGILAVHTDEVVWHPKDGSVTWFKDELGTIWCKFMGMEEDVRTTCIPQLYVTRVDLE
jgi:hypothetical protein